MSLPLSEKKKRTIQFGCICIMLAIAMYGLALSTLTTPILKSIDAMNYVSLFSILCPLGISIMTPVGGKLGDLIGRKNIVVIPGIICILAGIGIAYIRSLVPLMICLLILGLAQGTFTAAPFIITGLIHSPQDVPKQMGFLATAVAVGGFGGSIIAGVLTDLGFLEIAIILPAIPLLIGILLIGMNLPNQKREGEIHIDVAGIVTLAIALSGILLSLNFSSALGIFHPVILLGFAVGILALFLLIKMEANTPEPLIPLHLFKNYKYTLFLIVGFLCYFYQNAMNIYAPISALNVLGVSASATGSLQLPRTLLTILLPALLGTWVGKNQKNMWIAMMLAAALVGIPMFFLGFTTPATSLLTYFIMLAITGIAESFRSVSITPAAQSALSVKDIGIGTSLISFSNSLSNTISSAVFGSIYNACTVSAPSDIAAIQNGINAVFLSASAISFLGAILVLLFIRPLYTKKDISQ